MYLYSAVCYFITILSSTKSYVLLAANIEDFRTLAKQFVPDSMADDILEMAKDAINRDNTKQPHKYKDFHGEEPAADDANTEPSDSEVAIRSAHKNKKVKMGKSSHRISPKYKLSLDDLVEKVKERLQSELTQMAVTAAKKKILLQSKEKKNLRKPHSKPLSPNDSSDAQATDHPPHLENLPSRYAKHVEDNVENTSRDKEHRGQKPKHEASDKKYVAEMFVAEPPKYLYDLGKPVTLQQNVVPRPVKKKTPVNRHPVRVNQNIQHEKRTIRPKRITTTTQDAGLFIGVNMGQTNDSYEDYVAPSKDDDFFEPATEAKHVTVKNVLDVSEEDGAKTKANNNANYEDDTTNYNKNKKRVRNKNNYDDKYFKQRLSNKESESPSVVPLVANNNEPRIQPYAEQLQETGYADETEEPVTEEIKARSASISFKEYTISQYLAPHVGNHAERNTNKRNKKPRQATVIPKRDMYKLSSPNYLVKIPIVGEKYKFDEPIPEQDREPENLEPMVDPKGLINGKLLV